VDRDGLAEFLRRRREALKPADVGLPAGERRRTPGLRREEVAALCHMSTDYYTRLEQGRGPRPSPAMLASIARGMRLTLDERDHLFRLAGHAPPPRTARSRHVSPGMMRILERLDCPAQVITDLGEILVQNEFADALFGDQGGYRGLERSIIYRWFAWPEGRIHPKADHDYHSRALVADLRAALARHPGDEFANELVEALLARSDEFAELWSAHEVAFRRRDEKRFIHPQVGVITLECQVLTAEEVGQRLLVFTARPGTEDAEKLELLRVVGRDAFELPALEA